MLASEMRAVTKSSAEVKTQVQQHSAQLAAELHLCKAGLEEQLRQNHADLKQQLQHVSEACLAAVTQPQAARSQQHTDVVSTSVVSFCDLPRELLPCHRMAVTAVGGS